jgi:hypothetical protein
VRRGSYFGTEIDGKWWRRYRGPGFFARGNGEFWMDEGGLHFRRLLTDAPLSIRFDEMTAARLGRWHCGRSGHGRPVLKVDFMRDGRNLTAGFCLSGNRVEMEGLVEGLTERLSGR